MVTVAAQEKKEQIIKEDYISWEDFQAEYLTREDEFKYEWLNGIVEQTPRTMNRNQTYIWINILKFFLKIKEKNKIDGWLAPEIDNFFDDHHRRPDIAFYTEEAIEKNKENKDAIPQFVIEIISESDQINKVANKMEDYYAAKVEEIWHIFPQQQVVHVYKGKKMEVCRGKDLCSAEEVIKEFAMPVEAIFA